ncbi:fused MFS/spermidine synthase [Actinosynnema sp. NPDC047251]|uniref:Spermidine synthase-like protein n=1 Tax=Saccharothrix espanaensis (strain ATCC 51144 / DSM 44229 / JCM 9112 / NBRC 15066 / NRRL 15764) TaxID=1179773 RepID=K0JUY7_SACES|nr:fused MFS/spermidine synthase [Saccharothrix espanaensis]CCH29791.1 Spermidine synthase-like protein [Saccharothrix espanaensis DSM 44229]
MGRTRKADETITREVDSGIAELVPDPDVPRAWTLRLNGTPQSHVDLDDPRHLEFEYLRRLGHVADLIAPGDEPVRALHLGGGGLSLPRYVAATRPGSTQQVVEVDAALIDLVRGLLPLEKGWRVKIRNGDARAVLEKAPPDTFDLVVTDVFAGARTPAHLTSVEFVELAARALRGGGVYAANIGDGGGLGFAKAQAATVRAVFRHACVMAEPAVFRGRRFGNFVLLGSHLELPIADLARRTAGDPFPGRVEHDESLVRFIGGTPPTTDATATQSPSPPKGTWGLPND